MKYEPTQCNDHAFYVHVRMQSLHWMWVRKNEEENGSLIRYHDGRIILLGGSNILQIVCCLLAQLLA